MIDVDEAITRARPFCTRICAGDGASRATATTSNIAGKLEHKLGDIAAGFAAAEVIIERSFKTKPVHQGYIEPHACLVSVTKDGRATIWSSSQGHFMVRDMTGQLTGTKLAIFAPSPPKSAAASAARPSSTWSRWRWCWRASPAGRSRW